MGSGLPMREPWWCQVSYPEPVTVMRHSHCDELTIMSSLIIHEQNRDNHYYAWYRRGKEIHWEGKQKLPLTEETFSTIHNEYEELELQVRNPSI